MVVVLVRRAVTVSVSVVVTVTTLMSSMMVMIAGEMNIKFDAGNASLVAPGKVEMVLIQPQLAQLRFEFCRVDAQVDQGANEHVTADTTEQVQIKSLHPGTTCRFTQPPLVR